MREMIILECSECKRRNYTVDKNKKKHTARSEFKKYCKWCDKRTTHKESR